MAAKRPAKSKVHIAPPGDFIALGKQGKNEGESQRLPSTSSKKLLASGTSIKREASPSASLLQGGVTKRPKLLQTSQTFTALGRTSDSAADRARISPSPSGSSQLDELAIEVEPSQLLEELLYAEEVCDEEKIEGLLLGAAKHLKHNRSKPDSLVYLTLMYLAKTVPTIFNSELVIQAFCGLLKRELSLNYKAKGNVLVSVCACNVLMAAYLEEENWPEDFVKVFVDDSLGERVWVDRPDCKLFVDNIITAFNTKQASKALLQSLGFDTLQGPAGTPSGTSSPVLGLSENEDHIKSLDTLDDKLKCLEDDDVMPRYKYQQESIETYVMEILKDQLIRRQAMDAASRNMIRLLTATCGYSQVRLLSAQKMEMWLQNPKIARSAQELLMSICLNCGQQEPSDVEVLSILIKIRMKSKPIFNFFLTCMKEMIPQHPDNLRLVLTYTVYNELSNTRNPNNMALIAVVFQALPMQATKVLAEICQDLLTNKDDYLRAVRALVREIARTLKHELNLSTFCLSLMSERPEPKFAELDYALKERYIMSIADLVTLSIFLGITPSVRDIKGEKQDFEALNQYRQQVAVIQRDAVWWLHTIVPKFYDIKPADYVHCLQKVLCLETLEHYHNRDNWPSESDRGPMMRIASECPVLEDTLMRILVIGLSSDFPLNSVDAVELVDQLVKRAASLHVGPKNPNMLQIDRLELVDALLNLCAYRHPSDISLPKGYTPPNLVITNLYWKSWIILLILSSFNPHSLGKCAWEKYPTLKCLMEMVMTRNYKFPPPTFVTKELDVSDLSNQERQVAEQEKQEILEFESHLAAATNKVTITEANSLLVPQLMSMNPRGVARQPPQPLLEHLRELNDRFCLGQKLCRSRSPNFLLDIIQRQGASQSMPWLAELVESSEGSLEVLPVQCLCEFLLHDSSTPQGTLEEDFKQMEKHKKKQKIKKKEELVAYLQSIIHGDPPDVGVISQILDYFLRRLSSYQTSSRALAIKGLSLLVHRQEEKSVEEEEESRGELPQHKWLLDALPKLPVFSQVRNEICSALRQACQIETDPSFVSACITFLSTLALEQTLAELDELALDMAQLIVERTTVINHILPQDGQSDNPASHKTLSALIDLYATYLRKAKEPDKEAYSWSNTQDKIILQWSGGDSATMHVLVVHAMFILLTYGPPQNDDNHYTILLDTWFPADGQPPSAFLLDTSEEALLLPDWLKLRMIRSHVSRLVDIALQDIEASQLLLFVQSFGIPVQSMTQLLKCLDTIVTSDPSVLQSVEDKVYMAQLIDIQHMRGADGGQVFRKLLLDEKQIPEVETQDEEMKEVNADMKMWQAPPHSEEIKTDLQFILIKMLGENGQVDAATEKEYHQLLRNLGTRKASTVIHVTSTLLQLLSTDPIVSATVCKLTIACPLLKLLVMNQNTNREQIIKLMQAICKCCDMLSINNTPAFLIAKNFLKSSEVKSTSSCKSLIELAGSTENLENQVLNYMKRKDVNKKGAEEDGKVKQACQVMAKDDVGLNKILIDWLELLDPELVSKAPELQHQLLFAKKSGCHGKKHQNEGYLLALLTHQSSWHSLHLCINTILKTQDLNPKAVLDFLYACLHIPKIWKGQEISSKREMTERIMPLTEQQIESVLGYVMQEAINTTASGSKSSSLTLRIELLLKCTQKDEKLTRHLVECADKQMHLSEHKHLYQQLLVELYVHCPCLIMWLPDLLIHDKSTQSSSVQVDLISFQLLSSLGQAGHGRRSEERMHDANIACRKLASQHPVLLLRQLPLINALLKGKTEFSIGQMRHSNYLLLFTHVLGLLETMQPHIFHRDYSTDLDNIIQSFMSLLKTHCMERIIAPIIAKFVKFLNNYINCEQLEAGTNLQKYINTLSDVSKEYPDLSPLKSLLAALTLPVLDSAAGSQGGSSMSVARPSTPWSFAQIAPYLKKLQNATNSEDVLEVLRDLDETSKRKVDVLEHFLSDLKKFLLDINDSVRNTCYNLIMRYARHHPKSSGQFLGIFLQCLDSKVTDIVTSALKNLPEFCVLCQDHSDVLLQKAFLVGTTSAIDTNSYIIDTLQTLNLESAFT